METHTILTNIFGVMAIIIVEQAKISGANTFLMQLLNTGKVCENLFVNVISFHIEIPRVLARDEESDRIKLYTLAKPPLV